MIKPGRWAGFGVSIFRSLACETRGWVVERGLRCSEGDVKGVILYITTTTRTIRSGQRWNGNLCFVLEGWHQRDQLGTREQAIWACNGTDLER
jgi:hypothetical protein